MTAAPRKAGRRTGDSGTREAILAAARVGFGSAGYAGTTIRGVAREAGVDPALVHHFFSSKSGLFAAALSLPVDPAVLVPGLLAGGRAGLGERLVQTFLSVWDATPGQGPMLALLRSAVSDETAAASLRDLLSSFLGQLVAGTGSDRAELRTSLVTSQLIGIAIARYVVRIEPLATAGADVLGPALGPTLDRYLTGPLD